ncbi:MAG: bacterioferritin-associated ferredoxin [Halieaceae bacterium]|jgi:bacterioferritin-associated ferredoxin
MYVCICKGITDTQIRAAVQNGASSLCEVQNTLGVASQCGKCGILAREIVLESLDDQTASQSLVSQAAPKLPYRPAFGPA